MKVSDLKFEAHPAMMGGERAEVKFPNGYGASVLLGGPFYTKNGTYEVAVTDKNGLTYETPITDDVLGYLTEDEATQALVDIEALPKPK